MQKYAPMTIVHREGETEAAMREDSERGEFYYVAEVDARIAELEKSHQRYEKMRRLSPREFHSLWMQSIAGDRFDDLVDRLPS
jgi:hypothetical protein